jgi:hypothetical protein
MPETTYILAVLVITFSITFALRAMPFAVLGTLRESTLVQDLSRWMPVGVLGILAVTVPWQCHRLSRNGDLRRTRSRRDHRRPLAVRPAHAAQHYPRNSRLCQPGQLPVSHRLSRPGMIRKMVELSRS